MFEIVIKLLEPDDLPSLLRYLNQLDVSTRNRFAPHKYGSDEIQKFYQNAAHFAYISKVGRTSDLAAYFVLSRGYLLHDYARLSHYGILPSSRHDFTLAPSVADQWQGQGVGGIMLRKVMLALKEKGARRILLWGGVQQQNEHALRFYKKHGFKRLGSFEYKGWNDDMMLEL